MRAVPNWRRVLRHAWSIRLMILAAALSGVEVALPLTDGLLPVPHGVFAALSGIAVAAAFAARMVAQKHLGDWK